MKTMTAFAVVHASTTTLARAAPADTASEPSIAEIGAESGAVVSQATAQN